jgi:GNAT superfamily N-acetyltransferase
MKIRRATRDDAEVLTAQNIALAKESEDITLDPQTTLAGVTAMLLDATKGFYLVAEENTTVIGQLMITLEWSDWRNKPIWWVQSVYVQEPWRNQGVFTQLLQHIKKLADQEKVAFLRLYVHDHNIEAVKVYEKTGWRKDPYMMYHLTI